MRMGWLWSDGACGVLDRLSSRRQGSGLSNSGLVFSRSFILAKVISSVFLFFPFLYEYLPWTESRRQKLSTDGSPTGHDEFCEIGRRDVSGCTTILCHTRRGMAGLAWPPRYGRMDREAQSRW